MTKSPLESKSSFWSRIAGKPPEHRLRVSGIVQYPSLISNEKSPHTRIYMQAKGRWRIEESLVEFCEN